MEGLEWIKDAGGIAGMIIFAFFVYRLGDKHWEKSNETLSKISTTLVEVSETMKSMKESAIHERHQYIKQQEKIVFQLGVLEKKFEDNVSRCSKLAPRAYQ